MDMLSNDYDDYLDWLDANAECDTCGNPLARCTCDEQAERFADNDAALEGVL